MLSQTQDKVSNIVLNKQTQDLLHSYGLKAHSVTWEDTGRYKGSCWGPNISDMTLIVNSDGQGRNKRRGDSNSKNMAN